MNSDYEKSMAEYKSKLTGQELIEYERREEAHNRILESQALEKKAEQAKFLESLNRVMEMALDGCGASRVCRDFLLFLYNGYGFPFNMNDLRNLGHDLYADIIIIMEMDCRPTFPREIHRWWENGESHFDILKKRRAECDRAPTN